MPIYDYKCQMCKIDFEALVLSVRMLAEVDCPQCHSKNIEWQPSVFSFKFKSNPLGSYRGSCSNPYENLTLQHVRGEDGKPITVHSLKELREAEKKYNFIHAVANDDQIDLPPQNESWAGDVRHDYKWKWTPPEERNDMTGVSAGPTERSNLLLGD
jgi:putative FmdB family regulatory protein